MMGFLSDRLIKSECNLEVMDDLPMPLGNYWGTAKCGKTVIIGKAWQYMVGSKIPCLWMEFRDNEDKIP